MLQVADLAIGLPKSRGSINFDLRPGEIHAMMAESGAGKTGLARILAGLQQPLKGTILLNRQPVSIKNPAHAISLGLGVYLNNARYSHITHLKVKEYLFLWSKKLFISNKQLAAMARALLDEYEVNINPDAFVFNLTQEEWSLVFLLMLLARKPANLILDEPGADLSETGKQHLFRILQKYRNNAGILYLSNQLEEILQVADRVTILKEGATLACFPIETAKKNPGKVLGAYFGHDENESEQLGEFQGIIDALLQTTELITSEYELQDLLNLLAQKIAEATRADVCQIYIFNETSRTIVEHFRYTAPGAPEAGLKEQTVGEVIATGEPFVGSDLGEHDLHRLFGRAVPVASVMCVPIYLHKRRGGAVEISYLHKKAIAQTDVDLLKMFATQVAVAIENTRLLGRSTLLKEAHHRIKNNLQSMVSLLLLQLQSNSAKSLERIIWEIVDRIKTIASVHQILSQDERSIGLIDVKTIVTMVIANHKERMDRDRIRIDSNLQDLYISYKTATSIGLLVNELLSNCLEHAFPAQREGTIRIDLYHDDEHIHLRVADDGVGFDESAAAGSSASLGLTLVKTLVRRELRGNIRFGNAGGTEVRISFPKQQINY